jgi:hypothetical protein
MKNIAVIWAYQKRLLANTAFKQPFHNGDSVGTQRTQVWIDFVSG